MPKDVRLKNANASYDSDTTPLSPPPPLPADTKPISLPTKEQHTSPKSKSESSSSNFLTLTTKKKNIIIDGMRSLKKSRKSKTDNTLTVAPAPAAPLSLAEVSMSLQNLSFTSELYNVPTNNTAVQQMTPTDASCLDSVVNTEYFIESDRVASDEQAKEEDVYFVDAPVLSLTDPVPVTPSNYLPTQIITRFSDDASSPQVDLSLVVNIFI